MKLAAEQKLRAYADRIKIANQCLMTLQIDLTDYCVCKCKGCDHWKWPVKTKIDKNILLKNVLPYLEYFDSLQSIVFSGGEPLLYPEIESVVRELKQVHGLNIGIITSGLACASLDWESLSGDCSWIRFSTDGFTAENYAKTRGVDMFEQWTNNLKTLLKENEKTQCKTRLNVTIHDYNKCNFADNLVDFLIENDIDTEIYFWLSRDIINKLHSFYGPNEDYKTNLMIIISLEMSKIFGHPKSATLQLDKKINLDNVYKHYDTLINYEYHSCYIPKIFGLIASDGNVFPCCYMYEPVFSIDNQQTKFVIGNINENNLRQIYESDKYLEVLDAFMNCDKKFSQCKFCDRFDHINAYLNHYQVVDAANNPIFL